MELRNYGYDTGVFKSISTPKPSISIGNLSVGGTGKTPAIKFLLKHFGAKDSLVISRGYGRKSSGFHEVTLEKDISTTGDEPMEIKQAFPESKVVVCEKRVLAVNQTKEEKHERILFDDLFQHRSVKANCNILLSSYQNPFYTECVLPAGNLREFVWNKKRANCIVITKCPENLSNEQAEAIKKKVASNASIYFSTIQYGETHWHGPNSVDKKGKVMALSSIAKADLFNSEVKKRFDTVTEKVFPDHYSYTKNDIHKLLDEAKANDIQGIITTAKDMVKLAPFGDALNQISIGVIQADMKLLFHEEDAFIQHIKTLIQ